MKSTLYLLLILVIIFGAINTAGAAENAEIQITVILDGEDVSLESQVMVISGMLPTMLLPGQEKIASVSPGDYQIVAVLPDKETEYLPANLMVRLNAGELKKITINIFPMPKLFGTQLQEPFDDVIVESNIVEFDPEKAAEEELREALNSEDSDLRQSAFYELYKRQDNLFLGESLGHSKGEIRELSLNQLYNLTAEAKFGHSSEAIPIEENKEEIINCLQDPYLPAQIKAVEIMANYPEFPLEVLPTLIEALNSPEADLRYAAVRSLGLGLAGAGKEEKEAINALVLRVEEDPDPRLRREAIQGLKYFKANDARVYEALAEALSDQDLEVRRKSAEVIGEFGAAVPILNRITAALDDSDWQIKNNLLKSMQVLASSELEGIMLPVAEMLQDEDRHVRIQAVRVIRSAGPAGTEVLPALIKALSDERTEVIREAAWTINGLGSKEAEMAMPELLKLLTVETSELGHETVSAVANTVVTVGEAAVPNLREMLSHNKFEARARSASILGRIGPAAEEALPKLISIYQDQSEHDAVRREAYYAVEHISGEKPEL